MGIGKTIGFVFISLLWIWLCFVLIGSGGGFTFKNIFLIATSGIIIFVPLWKRYVKKSND